MATSHILLYRPSDGDLPCMLRLMDKAMKKEAPSVAADKFIVRLPDGMRNLIAEAATENNRTMNAEVVARLQSSFRAGQSKHSLPRVELFLGAALMRLARATIRLAHPDKYASSEKQNQATLRLATALLRADRKEIEESVLDSMGGEHTSESVEALVDILAHAALAQMMNSERPAKGSAKPDAEQRPVPEKRRSLERSLGAAVFPEDHVPDSPKLGSVARTPESKKGK